MNGATRDASYRWEYRLEDLPLDVDPETWARDLAAEGWEFAVPGTGVLVEVNRVTQRRYYLRRAVPPKTKRSPEGGTPT